MPNFFTKGEPPFNPITGATIAGATVAGATVAGGATGIGATVAGATTAGATAGGATAGATTAGATVAGATGIGATIVGFTTFSFTVFGLTVFGAATSAFSGSPSLRLRLFASVKENVSINLFKVLPSGLSRSLSCIWLDRNLPIFIFKALLTSVMSVYRGGLSKTAADTFKK